MRANYKQTLIKYIKSPSTWVILVIAMFISGFLSAGLPWLNFDESKPGSTNSYIIRVVSTIATASSYMAIFASIFAGFKSAGMFRDEMDQGTFLTLVSKPVRRSSILIGKWLALQTTLIGFAFLTTISFGVVTAILDKGHYLNDLGTYGAKTLRSQLPMVMIYLFMIIYLMCLIFSSIALLISTKLSYGGTIGASIALGVIIPITSLTWTFTHKESHYSLTNNRALKNVMNFEENYRELNGNSQYYLSESAKQLQREYFSKLAKDNSIFGLGISSGMEDGFESSWVGDFQYQIARIGAFASEEAIPNSSELLAASSLESSELSRTDLVPDHDHPLSKNLSTKDNGHTLAFEFIKNGIKDVLTTYDKIAAEGVTNYWKTMDQALHLNDAAYQWNIDHPNFATNPVLKVRPDGGVISQLTSELGWMANKSEDEVWAALDASYSGLSPEHIQYNADKANFTAGNTTEAPVPWFKPWRAFYAEMIANDNTVSLKTAWEAFETIFNMKKYGRTLSSVTGEYDEANKGKGLFIARATSHYAVSFESQSLIKELYAKTRSDEFVYNYKDWFDEIQTLVSPVSKVLFNSKSITKGVGSVYSNIDQVKKEHDLKALFNRNFLDNEAHYINFLLTAADEHPEIFVKLSTKGYADKHTILWVYLGIAFGLLPFVYLIIRFKDYR